MVIKQLLIDFKIPDDTTKTDEDVFEIIADMLNHHVGAIGPTLSKEFKKFGKLYLFEDGERSQCTVRMLPDGLVTIDIMFNIENCNDGHVIKVWNQLKCAIKENESRLSSSNVIPPITRGREITNYYDTSDGRLKEYDFDEIVLQETSEYQDILIVHSPQFGNMLFLDSTEMLAESDIAYTQAILGNGREQFENKTVLILGGGDGGIIHELLKENPKFVTMVEIDRVVIDAAKKYLRGICGSTMDSLQGTNYQIIVDDCFVELRKYIQEGRTFDYILNDLTDIPIESQGGEETTWEFIGDVLDLSLQVLDQHGKYLAQGTNGATNRSAHERYEHLLSNSRCPIEFKKEFVFVPSFWELWTFYEVWKTDT